MGHTNAKWDSIRNYIVTTLNNDSLLYHKGGCYHFATSVIIKSKVGIPLDSLDYWLPKTIQVVQEMDLEEYTKALQDSSYYFVDNFSNTKHINIEVEDAPENIVFEGISFEQKDNYVEIKVSEYIN